MKALTKILFITIFTLTTQAKAEIVTCNVEVRKEDTYDLVTTSGEVNISLDEAKTEDWKSVWKWKEYGLTIVRNTPTRGHYMGIFYAKGPSGRASTESRSETWNNLISNIVTVDGFSFAIFCADAETYQKFPK